MVNLSKYRQISIWAMIVLVITTLMTFASFWNLLLSAPVKYEGWVITFMLLAFFTGISLFIIAFRATDTDKFELEKRNAFEAGKNEVLYEISKKSAEDGNKQKIKEADTDNIVQLTLSGMKGIRTESGFCNKILANLGRHLGIVQGIMYLKDKNKEVYNPTGEYALTSQKPLPFAPGENLAGQVAESKSMMTLYDVPENYFNVSSGLGNSKPRFLIFVPVMLNNSCIAVLELATFKKPDEIMDIVLNKITSELGERLNKFMGTSKE
jgi:hypothetical protein